MTELGATSGQACLSAHAWWSPFIEGLHGEVLQQEGAADHEGGGSQADKACTAQVEPVGLVGQQAALDEVNDHNRRRGIEAAVHGAHCCCQDS